MILNLLWKNCSLLITEEKEISNFSARIFVYENVRIRLFAIVYFLILPFHAFSQKVSVSLLASSEIKRETPYQIKEIIDLRNSKNKIGDVFGENRKPQEVVFQGNLDQLALRFFENSIRPSKSGVQAIQARILQLDLYEKPASGRNIYEGEIQLIISFYRMGNYDPVHLVDFEGSVEYKRSPNRMDMIENVVNRVFGSALQYFDTWMNMQVMSNRNLATKVSLDVIDRAKNSHKDTVYYNPSRPLVWEDFADKPKPGSRFNAAIFTSFSIQGNSIVESGTVLQTIEIDIYMLPEQSWVRNPSEYALNHEQRHFDVVRIVADRLVHKLKNLELDPEMYEATINDAYFEAYREMNRLQEIYDKQTRHGMDTFAQQNWNNWIDEGLAGNWQMIEQALIGDM
jgi:hypothetical protein